MTKLIILLFLTIILFCDGNCGVISWFKSIGKPIWYNKIDQRPLIETFQPKGLRVSIADVDGLKLFKFHGNLNSNPILLEKLITQKSNGRWWYINEDIEFKIDDKLKYWIYVQVNDEELLFSEHTHKVKNLIPLPNSLTISEEQSPVNVELSNATVEKLCPCTNNTLDIGRDQIELTKNEYIALNNAIMAQNTELDSIYRLIHEEMQNNTKILFTDTKRSLNNTNLAEIKLILKEQLNLNDLGQIFLQDSTPCGILLEVYSTIEKLQILIAGEKYLKNTSQQFLEPTKSDLFIFQFKLRCAFVNRTSRIRDQIDPIPYFKSFRPNGLEISLPDINGLQIFGFHANLNKPIARLATGEYHYDIISSVNGNWTYLINDISLRIGDILNYWIYVQIDGVGEFFPKKRYIVTELIRKTPDLIHQPTIISQPKDNIVNCNQTNLKNLEKQIDSLENKFESFSELVNDLMKNLQIGTELILTGVNQQNLIPLDIVKDVITNQLDLLDLSDKILKAEYINNGILFKISSPVDKKRILIRAVKSLKNSKYKIIDTDVTSSTNFNFTPTINNIVRNMTTEQSNMLLVQFNTNQTNPEINKMTDAELAASGLSDLYDIDFRLGSLILPKTNSTKSALNSY